VKKDGIELPEEFVILLKDYLRKMNMPDEKLLDFQNPEELGEIMDFHIHENGVDEERMLADLQNYLSYSLTTGNKQFFNQLYAGFNMPAFLGEVITALSNTSMYTYEVAPVATMMEAELIRKMCGIAGFKNGDGIFVTGGSNANLIAMFSARNRIFPEIKTHGLMNSQPMSIFVSDQAHYSLDTAANLLGIGTSAVYKVKTDQNGRMLAAELQREIYNSLHKGEKPFFVVCTAGTTMLGAYDPIDDICNIADKHDLWVHVDGSFGGSLILGSQRDQLFIGLEKADSFAWNPHKLMNIPLICSVLLVREKGCLQRNLTDVKDDYIFHDTDTGFCDLGKKSIQCGRRVDSLKLWLSWRYYGDKGYRERMDKLMKMAIYFEEQISLHSRFELLSPRQSLTVCFRYLPVQGNDINDFNFKLRELLRKSGKTAVNFGYIGNDFAFRWVIANPEVTERDIDQFFDYLNFYASRLEQEEVSLN
jgi:glutamate/tyrosine decarboxylase-like PLP-dependent enzyme